MRSSLKLLGRSALLVAICVAVGFALLLAAFALPTEPMRENALASQDVFAREGSYPMARTLGVDAKLDNFTDSMKLVHAGYQAPETTLLQRTLNVYRPFPHGNRGAAGVYAESLAAPAPAPQSNYGRYRQRRETGGHQPFDGRVPPLRSPHQKKAVRKTDHQEEDRLPRGALPPPGRSLHRRFPRFPRIRQVSGEYCKPLTAGSKGNPAGVQGIVLRR